MWKCETECILALPPSRVPLSLTQAIYDAALHPEITDRLGGNSFARTLPQKQILNGLVVITHVRK
eukprot:3566369-Amphidinium_carterae.1